MCCLSGQKLLSLQVVSLLERTFTLPTGLNSLISGGGCFKTTRGLLPDLQCLSPAARDPAGFGLSVPSRSG